MFVLTLRNTGIPDIEEIQVFDDYFVAVRRSDGHLQFNHFGALSSAPSVTIPAIQSKMQERFTIDFRGINDPLADFALRSNGGTEVALLTVRYRRSVDGRQFCLRKPYIITARGSYLFDGDTRGIRPPIPTYISYDEIQAALGRM